MLMVLLPEMLAVVLGSPLAAHHQGSILREAKPVGSKAHNYARLHRIRHRAVYTRRCRAPTRECFAVSSLF